VQLERAVEVRSLRLDLTQSAGLGLSKALLVTRVTPGSPAEAQGLPVGSTVISVSGESVKSLSEFKAAVQALRDRGDKMSTLEYEVQPPEVAAAPSNDGSTADDVLTMSEDESSGEGSSATSAMPVDSKHVPPPPKPPPPPTDDFEAKAVPSRPPASQPSQSTKAKGVKPDETKPLALGDSVTWKGSDDDLPPGTVGKIVKLHPADGDAECLFETPTGGPQTFTFMLNRLDRYPPASSSQTASRTSRKAKPTPGTSNILHQGGSDLSFANDPNFRLSSYFADDHSSSSGGDSRPRPDAAGGGDEDYPTLHQSWPTTALEPSNKTTTSTGPASAGAKGGGKDKQVPKKKKSLTAAVFGVMATNKAKEKGKGVR